MIIQKNETKTKKTEHMKNTLDTETINEKMMVNGLIW